MSIKNENSNNNLYIYRHADGNISEVITYRKYLIEEIKKHPSAKDNMEIQSFSPESVTNDKFEKFISIAKNARFTIYQVNELKP